MTMSAAVMFALEKRGLDVELASKLGFRSVEREGGEALVIPFLREGRLVRRKYRIFGRTEGKWSADKGAVRLPWNEDALRDDALLGLPLVITEGELDALAAIQAGVHRTISVPDGAPPSEGQRQEAANDNLPPRYAWIDAIRPLLHKDRVSEIVLAVDNDDNGAALLQDLSVLLGRYRCKFVTWPKARDPEVRGRARCKDLNEVLEDYGEAGVRETLARAQWLKVDGVYLMSELPPPAPRQVYAIGFEALGEHYRMRLGDFAVVTGIPGMGKTTVVQDIVCRVCRLHGLKAAWASFEQQPQTDHRRAFREWYIETPIDKQSAGDRAAADAWIDRHHVFLVPGEDEDVSLDWMLEKIEVAVVRHGCQVVVIDPWNEMDHDYDARRETETQYIGRAIRTLRRLAKAFNVHLIVIAHPAKMQKGQDGLYLMPTLYDISGSANWYNKCDTGFVVHKSGADETTVKVAKSKYWDVIGRPGAVRMAYCKDDRHFRELERLGGG